LLQKRDWVQKERRRRKKSSLHSRTALRDEPVKVTNLEQKPKKVEGGRYRRRRKNR